MAKTLGIEIGKLTMKMALASPDKVYNFWWCPVPEGMVEDGQIVDWELAGEFLADRCKEYKLAGHRTALVLPEGLCYVNRLSLADMTPKQMQANLKYEFEDLLQGDEKYIFDYEVLERVEDEDGKKHLDILAAAANAEIVENYKKMAKKAGLKLTCAMPATVVYQDMMSRWLRENPEEDRDFVLLYLGYENTFMRIFVNGKYESSKQIDMGIGMIFQTVADALGISEKEARDLVKNDPDHILESPTCIDIYETLTIDIMRTINFFNYSYQQSNLSKIFCCGRGADVKPLLETIGRSADIETKGIHDIFRGMADYDDPLIYGSTCVGVTWNN